MSKKAAAQSKGKLPGSSDLCAEKIRLEEDGQRKKNWKRWGPYLAERQWGTVREDYSADGDAWRYLTHEDACARAYRWGEDGLLGIADRQCRLCFAVALWNGRDSILKERLFGLAGPEGNHGEDVKECYYYLDATPTHSYLKALYKYPQVEFPYARLREENRRRSREEPEFELIDTGAFDGNRYFDVQVEYAKETPEDILIRISITNRGGEPAPIHLLPTLWFRNMWSWGTSHESCDVKPVLRKTGGAVVRCEHETLGNYYWELDDASDGATVDWLFTENETNNEKLYNSPNHSPYTKDAFHEAVIRGEQGRTNPEKFGTKAAPHLHWTLAGGETKVVRLRLSAEQERPARAFGASFDAIFERCVREADDFYQETACVRSAGQGPGRHAEPLAGEKANVARQAYAGLIWSKQFYHYVIADWLAGDPAQPSPPESRLTGRNTEWGHLYNRDIISMPDKWEYPWYAAWDLAFHMLPFAHIDPQFSKDQLNLFLREWYMHPNGQIPAYEWHLSDVNPPVHAWACWRVYKMTGPRGGRDRVFLARVFQKLLINFTWWVNRKDPQGRNLFAGGFLGLDNIGVFDRSKPLPTGGHLAQADGTAWMAFYCGTMLSMALELAETQPEYEDIASKFFEHFVAIADAINYIGGSGLWHEGDGFYYDQLEVDGEVSPIRLRSMVGIIPLFSVEFIEDATLKKLAGFSKRTRWFLKHRKDLADKIAYLAHDGCDHGRYLLAIPSRERLERVLRYLFDEKEFLSPYGIRSLSRIYKDTPYVLNSAGRDYRVNYVPGDSDSWLFGGNSNWRGPVWMPVNYLLIEALERYHHFYGDTLTVEFPTGSGNRINLKTAAEELSRRLTALFLPNGDGRRPSQGWDPRYASDPHWRELVLFHEYFHGDNGQGLGASHQTGWTALITRLLESGV